MAQRYAEFARSTGRTKTFYMTQALADAIETLEFEYGVLRTAEEVRSGKQETYTTEQVLTMLENL